jgi:carotenoid cleavage dioxygenase-like enzyme
MTVVRAAHNTRVEVMMDRFELLAALEEGLENGRITPQTAAFIAAELLGVEAYETGYQEWAVPSAPAEEPELALAAD